MTTDELRIKINNELELGLRSITWEVDAETYGNVCQDVFNYLIDGENHSRGVIPISVGPNKGIIFKNVELILKEN